MGDKTVWRVDATMCQFLATAGALLLICSCSLQAAAAAAAGPPVNPLAEVRYVVEEPLIMNMSSTREIVVIIKLNKDAMPARGADVVRVHFKTSTISPQFNILSLDSGGTHYDAARSLLESTNYQMAIKLKLHANYIGHAVLQPVSVEFMDAKTLKSSPFSLANYSVPHLPVTIVQFEGVWGVVFLVSVSILIIISYLNLGAQLDEDNLRLLIERPKTLILGSLISILVMPSLAWFLGLWFFRHQPLFRIGSFVFAAGPAASASTLWTVMLNSDKELSVGLQVISTVGALFTMPLFLWAMERSLASEPSSLVHHQHIRVPYGRLAQTLLVLLLALLAGWRLGRNKRARELSSKIFRPLVFFVLIFIIVFSSILYWHIYQMFDWTITLVSLAITLATYLISGALGYLIECDLDRGVAIAITSAYKNSGIAFAVLLVAFAAPDTYIAYVPCLTQVVTTSLTLYLTYAAVSLINCVRRRGQPQTIRAATTSAEVESAGGGYRRRSSTSRLGEGANGTGAEEARGGEEEEEDEFIAMSVTDIGPECPLSAKSAGQKTTPAVQTEGGAGEPAASKGQVSIKITGATSEQGATIYSDV